MARPGQRIGKWVLIDVLGEGGNAVVWRARDENGAVAVKVLKARKAYERAIPVVPVRDCPPEKYRSRGNLAHYRLPPSGSSLLRRSCVLAMPIAQDIAEALEHDPPLEQVVAAVADIADVLAGLAADGVYHRDIKPGNLYYHGPVRGRGFWAGGVPPGKEGITAQGRVVGPRNFIAPEVLLTPDRVSWPAVDAYGLAKKLWVLATVSPAPLPGELRIDSDQARLRNYVQHPSVHLLEGLLERAPSNDPAQRPSSDEL